MKFSFLRVLSLLVNCEMFGRVFSTTHTNVSYFRLGIVFIADCLSYQRVRSGKFNLESLIRKVWSGKYKRPAVIHSALYAITRLARA